MKAPLQKNICHVSGLHRDGILVMDVQSPNNHFLCGGIAEIHFKGVMFRFSSFLGVLHGRVNASHGRRDGHRGEGGPVQPRTGTELRLMDL